VGGYGYAGQSCISVQRVFVHQPAYEEFMDNFVPKVRALKVGHPLDEATDLGSLISVGEAERVAGWLVEARAAGAECLIGGDVKSSVVQPTIVVKAGPDLRVNNQEIFAPVVTIQTYADFEDALRAVNDSAYGLQAGLFTADVKRIFRAYEEIEVGGLMVNEVPTWRIDPMPYGGVKQSGFGREGLKYAIEEMTEPKLLVINLS
jgi:acyl-CoA reductase-like NAD-dependent aldehyde dehydrogenase